MSKRLLLPSVLVADETSGGTGRVYHALLDLDEELAPELVAVTENCGKYQCLAGSPSTRCIRDGLAGLKQAFHIFLDATPCDHRIDDMVAEGDRVVTRLTAIGTHGGRLARYSADVSDLACATYASYRDRIPVVAVVNGEEVAGRAAGREAAGFDLEGLSRKNEPTVM